MYIFKRKKLSRKKLRKNKKLLNRFKLKQLILRRKGINRRRRLRGYRLRRLKYMMKLIGPEGNTKNVGETYVIKKERFDERKDKMKYLSTKISVNLFQITYNVLLNYHCPLGKRRGEWRYGVMLTNIFMIRNRMSILDLTNIFFELRKMVNRLFKAVKLRKGVALLNGRRYGWRRVFTLIFEKWLPGFFTNFYLNMAEMVGYFIKRKFLTRRQKMRALSLTGMCLDKNYLTSFRFNVKAAKLRENKLINFMKLPTVSLSLIDNTVWLRECQKEGISAIQIVDSNSEIERVNYPIISNQKSIAFLSFISLLAKEIAYQARRWELTRLKKHAGGYNINSRIREQDLVNSAYNDYFWWQDKLFRYKKRLSLGYKVGKLYPSTSKEKFSDRVFLIRNNARKVYRYNKLDKKISGISLSYNESVSRAKILINGNKKI